MMAISCMPQGSVRSVTSTVLGWWTRSMGLLLTAGLVAGFLVHDAEASKQKPAGAQKQPIALTGGTVHTVSGSILEGATVLFEAVVITGIGNDLDLPETPGSSISRENTYTPA